MDSSTPRQRAAALTFAMAGVLAFSQAASATTLSAADAITYNACAQAVGSTIRLTNPGGSVPAACSGTNGNLKGTAFVTTPISNDPGTSFSAYFAYRITGGADGLALVIQNDPRGATAAGGGGEGLGFSDEFGGNPGIGPAWRVLVDTFQNAIDPGDNYIAFSKNLTQAGNAVAPDAFVAANPGYDLNNGETQYIWADYNPANKLLSVFASQSSVKPGSPLFWTRQDLSELGTKFFVGFSAGIGGSVAIHDIEDFRFETTGTAVPLPPTVWLLATGCAAMVSRRRSRQAARDQGPQVAT